MYAFVFNFFVKIPFIKPLHKGIDGPVRVLQAANQKLTLSNACFFDRRVILHISNWKIGVKNFVEPFLSAVNTDFVTIFFNFVVEVDLFGSFLAILGANNLDFDDLSDVFVEYFKRRLFHNCFGLIWQFIKDILSRFFLRWRDDINDKIEKLLDLSTERTVLVNFDDSQAFSFVEVLMVGGRISHNWVDNND